MFALLLTFPIDSIFNLYNFEAITKKYFTTNNLQLNKHKSLTYDLETLQVTMIIRVHPFNFNGRIVQL